MSSKEATKRNIEIDTTARWEFALSLSHELKPWVFESIAAYRDQGSAYGKLMELERILAHAMYARALEDSILDHPTNIPEDPLR